MADGVAKNLEVVVLEWKIWLQSLRSAAIEWWREFRAEPSGLRKVFHKGVANFLTEFYRALGVPVPRTAMYLTTLYLLYRLALLAL